MFFDIFALVVVIGVMSAAVIAMVVELGPISGIVSLETELAACNGAMGTRADRSGSS